MTELESILCNEIDNDNDYIVSLRRYFHSHPELSKEEYLTAEKIEKELDLLGISHKRVTKTGVYAEIVGEKPGKHVIVLRADIDALPVKEEHETPYKSIYEGKSHACGHDCNTSCLLGAVRALVKHKDLIKGKIIINFQPGEEIGYGARFFVDEGHIDEADRSFGIHMSSREKVGNVVCMAGPNNASVDYFHIHINGRCAHIASPEKGIDALHIASQIVVEERALFAQYPIDEVLIGIGKMSAGTQYNVIAGTADIEGSLRSMTHEMRKVMKDKIEEIAKRVAEEKGGSVEIEWKDFTSPLINDEQATLEAQETAASIFGEDRLIKHRKADLSGDDFAEYIIKVPGHYAYIGSGNAKIPETCVAHHDTKFDVDERCLAIGAKMYACYAVNYLNK